MGQYLKLFKNEAEYEGSSIKGTFNHIIDEAMFADSPSGHEYVVAKYNVTSTSSPTIIGYSDYISGFSKIEIDGVEQPSVVSAYTFDTLGEHTVKYTLTDQTSIGNYAFRNCTDLTSIAIPNSVANIGNYAFYSCRGLTSVTIPDGVTSIGSYAFYSCSRLTSVTIGSGVTYIAGYAFYSCSSLTSITIPNSVKNIGSYAFQNCSYLSSVTIGNGVTSIGQEAFSYCYGLTSIISNATTAPTIQNNTFKNVKPGGTLTVPTGSIGYDTWMGTGNYYLGKYGWTKVEQ